jgi:hypothetical protein
MNTTRSCTNKANLLQPDTVKMGGGVEERAPFIAGGFTVGGVMARTATLRSTARVPPLGAEGQMGLQSGQSLVSAASRLDKIHSALTA